MAGLTRQTGHSDCTTEGIRVQVGAAYLPVQSAPEMGRYYFAYRVILTNVGDRSARLVSRLWRITDAENAIREVEGPGVVGEHPLLHPGDRFEYMSGSPLSTSWGTMEGHFIWERDDGDQFQVAIGRFFLAETVAPLAEMSTL
ncbi:MAG: Co2+/Mg2+ efflux protein ApaG [Planctomycetota bacterium]|jgi:ApaG protein|nr:Co2+/Mg2+ efflux protein ApaG [Planctomycetota bacterium]